MSFTEKQKDLLQADLHGKHVSQRTQSGRQLSYIEGWHAIAEANRIFGFDAWYRETLELRLVAEGPRKMGSNKDKEGFGVSYVARVRVTVNGMIVREGVGAGHGIDADLGLAHESATKEAETDAMKRALMTFGNPFGLALYDKTQSMVSDVDTARLAEFEEALEVVPDKAALDKLILDYTQDIVELRVKRKADWQLLNTKVTAKLAQFKEPEQ